MLTHNTHYSTKEKSTKKSTKVSKSFFKRFKLKLRCTVDSWHGSIIHSRVVEVPRPYVCVNFAGNPVSARFYLYDFVRCFVAEQYFHRDSSSFDFNFSPVKFTFSDCSAKNILSGLLGDGSFTFDFVYADLDCGCDSVSCGRCDFRIFEV